MYINFPSAMLNSIQCTMPQ